MVEEDARLGVGQVGEDGFYGHAFRHHDRHRLKSVSFHRRFDEKPFGRADPLMATSGIIEEGFKFDVVDLTLGIPQNANGKATERLIRQVTPICCEA